MDAFEGPERRSGSDRRRSVAKRNGLAVLMAGCSDCDRIAPSPIEMQAEGWEIISDEHGLVSITCPKHLAPMAADPDAVPDWLILADDPR